MKPLHEELKTIRLDKNISLQDISDKMRIRMDYLVRIEDGDYTISPTPFLRAFLREYAEAVEIDPQLVMQKFDNKIDSIISAETSKNNSPESDQQQIRAAANVKILTPEQPSEQELNPETTEDEETTPKKRKRRKKTAAKKKPGPKKPRKTIANNEEPAETGPETPAPEETEVQTSLFYGAAGPSEEPAPETQNDLLPESEPEEDHPAVIIEEQPEEHTEEHTEESPEETWDERQESNQDENPEPENEESIPEEPVPPAEPVKFKQVKIIDDDHRRDVSKNINTHLSAEQKASDIQFYGVIGIMAATIALIIYLVASGIIF